MIRILILDDDPDKAEKIRTTVTSNPEIVSDDVILVRDLIQARDACRQSHFDLLILDLRLPNRIGDAPEERAGCEFIKELNASTTLIRPYHIIGLTAYSDTLRKSDPIFENDLWRIILYDASTNNWQKQLSHKIDYLINSKRSLLSSAIARHVYDLAIVTALHVPEFQSVLDLPCNWETVRCQNDPTIYYKGRIKKEGRAIAVIAACAQQMGMPAAAVVSSKIISQFRPRYIAICGIAATVRGTDTNLGDILIADQSWDYESGKHRIVDDKQIFEPDPRSIPLRVDIKERVLHLRAQSAFLSEIQNSWRGGPIDVARLQVHVGPLASGAAVVQDETITEHIRARSRKLIGLDMETYGVFYAAENSSMPRAAAISIKSACDYADRDKSDQYQAYAAFTSANYLYRLAVELQ
jgi:nucleoside phosphorylase/CheY-like chemotaxis protein